MTPPAHIPVITAAASTSADGLVAPNSALGTIAIAAAVLTVAYIAWRLVRRSKVRLREFIVEVASQLGRVGVAGVIVVGTLAGARTLARVDGSAGTIGSALFIAGCVAVSGIAGLFIIRQFLAPPWWRLNNWNPGFEHSYDGSLRAIARWIWQDSMATLRSFSVVDTVVILFGIPALIVALTMVMGTSTALMWVLGSQLILYLALGVALVTANRIPRTLMTRLVDLRTAARRIASGDLTARVSAAELGEYEELAELVRDLNRMAHSLESREAENQLLQYRLQTTLHHEQDLATRDGLTQLRNRRYFDQSLEAEVERTLRTGQFGSIAIIDLDNFKQVNDKFGHAEGDAVLQRTAHALVSTLRPYDLPARLGGEEFGVIFPQTSPEDAAIIMERIMERLATAGPEGRPMTFSGGVACFPQHGTDAVTLYRLADEAAYDSKLKGKARVRVYDPTQVVAMDSEQRRKEKARADAVASARSLVAAVDAKESIDNAHSERVGQIAAAIVRVLGAPEEFCNLMHMCGLVHDIGKISMDDSLFNKPGQLSEEEFAIIRRHPEIGARIVTNAGLGEIAPWVRHHHEHWDGTGYPSGLAGDEIPFGARVIGIAEAVEVMTSDRVYRQRMLPSRALEELHAASGTKFDPQLVDAVDYLFVNDMMPLGLTLDDAEHFGDMAA